MNPSDGALFCDRSALAADERLRHASLLQRLSRATAEVVELADGYLFRYTTDTTWPTVAEYVDLERRCCPFFRFDVQLEPNGGAVSLRMTGDGLVKRFLAEQMRQLLQSRTQG